jgi:CheY-like chemotaxis protein
MACWPRPTFFNIQALARVLLKGRFMVCLTQLKLVPLRDWNLSRAAAYRPSIAGEAAMDEPIAVLVVDDDASIQNVLEETLTEGGFPSKVASSGEEAIALLNAGRYRVLIVDVAFGRDQIKGWAVPGELEHSTRPVPLFILPAEALTNGQYKACPTAFC